MWIQVRSMDGRKSIRIDGLSKLSKIEDLRIQLIEEFDAPVERQRLFYRGKQLEDGHSLFDYDVGLNDIVQILVRQPISQDSDIKLKDSNYDKISNATVDYVPDKENEPLKSEASSSNSKSSSTSSKYYIIGNLVDAKDPSNGAWFEAKIVGIKPSGNSVMQEIVNGVNNSPSKDEGSESDNLLYRVMFEDYEDEEEPIDLTLKSIRPRARKNINFENVKVGDLVMINYNIEEPSERGYWYDFKVTSKKSSRTQKELLGTILMGIENTKLEKCTIIFIDEIFAIEKNTPLNTSKNKTDSETNVISRQKIPQCSHCKDIPTKKCKICSCHICGGKDVPEKQIICDECDLPYHLWCLDPPLSSIPDSDEWYCPDCKNDETEVVRAGEKLKPSKKKSKMVSANSSSSRDWGKGMACVGRTKECTIVPPNHFGPVPGVEVGTMWKFRVQVSESGTHRPHVAGIHGRESEGAYSIVLSGGYEDDLDEGVEFKYTGSGGRDLSGNKRCAEQSCDQTLTRMNKALALNCAVAINKNGAEAAKWENGKPVRVVRNCKGRKHSEFCPEEGNRYDGIYKVVKYWPEKGKSGYLVWRYLLRRDDQTPAPWTKEGKKRIKKLGLAMQYPEGYLESQAEKERQKNEDADEKKQSRKRANSDDDASTPKRKKHGDYSIPNDLQKLIEKDTENSKLWDECKQSVGEGYQEFLKKVETIFSCICCQEVVFKPVTTECFHNICKACLQSSFKAEVYSCPTCRYELGEDYSFKVNEDLQNVMMKLFPGYDAGR